MYDEELVEKYRSEAVGILDEVFQSEKYPNKEFCYTTNDWVLEDIDGVVTLTIEVSVQIGHLFGKAYHVNGQVFYSKENDLLLELYDHDMMLPTQIVKNRYDNRYYWDTDMTWETM